jgi:hypothetical protein
MFDLSQIKENLMESYARRHIEEMVSEKGFKLLPAIIDHLVEVQSQKDRRVCNLTQLSQNCVCWTDTRSKYGGSGGIAKFDQLWVYYHGQVKMQEWQWRDQYDPNRDRFDLCITGIGKVQLDESGEKAVVTVELLNRQAARSTTVEFEKITVQQEPELSEDNQAAFLLHVQKEVEKILDLKNQLFKFKPVGQSYLKPRIKQQVLLEHYGIAAVVIEEQIDHRQSDRQVRYQLYLIRALQEAKEIFEDHSYENREGTAVVSVVSLDPKKILVSTRKGNRELTL